MTCASCASHIERGLNALRGVHASVNFAVERAHVEHDEAVSAEQLLAAVESTGYHAELIGAGADPGMPDPEPGRVPARLIGSAILAVPVVALSMVMPWQFPGWQILALALTAPIVLWGGSGFHRAAIHAARRGQAGMDTLVSLGTLAAFGWSAVVVAGGGGHGHGGGHVYFEVAAAVTVFLLAGRHAEARAKRSAGAALRELAALGAKEATVIRDGVEVRVPAGELEVGDVVVVRPGERVATDGVVIEGASALDVSAMTGEPVPVDVGLGNPVLGGSVNTFGRITLRANKVGAETQLARMAGLVAEAQSGKASIQRLADRVSAVFVPVVLLVSALTLAGWLLLGQPAAAAFTAAVAVLIIACPCALGLATPTAILVGTGRGAQLGVLIKNPQVLETATGIDTVVLDKTGTVTTGRMSVHDVQPLPGEDADEVLARAAAVEAASEHPVAAAVVAAAADRGLLLAPVADFVNEPGTGVRGAVGGVQVRVSRAGDAESDPPANSQTTQGRTTVEVRWGGRRRGMIHLADAVKPTSAAAVAELKAMGIRPVLLTGDAAGVAARVAAEIGIDDADVVAGVLPEQKATAVEALRRDGRRVAMVGDGVNDSAALATADLGMAMGTGTDAAIEAADVTLMRGDLRAVPTALRLAAHTVRIIKQNLFWAFAYNAAAIPLAAFGLLNPMIAGAAMAASSVLVVTNSLRLRRFGRGH
jgi:Cu+-exporting ATPase